MAFDIRRKSEYFETDQIKKRIQQTRHHLANATIVNSNYNTMFAILEERQRDVDHFLYRQEEDEKTKKEQVWQRRPWNYNFLKKNSIFLK